VSTQAPIVLELVERQERTLTLDELSYELGETIWKLWGGKKGKIAVDFPSAKTNDCWILRPGGWVGYLPVTPDFALSLQPKIPVQNLFRMLEYAYLLKSFAFLEGLYQCTTLEEVYSQLASLLSRRVADRARQGLLREYRELEERLPYLRGRLDVTQLHRTAGDAALPCRFEEHGPDIEDNQILVWTLHILARCQGLQDHARAQVRLAYRALRGRVSLVEFGPRDCVGRSYHRLNQDYEPMHAICRLFLESRGPSLTGGLHARSLPFEVNMDSLFERFVYEWLSAHLPRTHLVSWQDSYLLSESNNVKFKPDIQLKDAVSGKVVCVIDTKNKAHENPSTQDLAQVVAYCTTARCTEGVLCYPAKASDETQATYSAGDVRVRRLAFPLADDLERDGQAFLNELLIGLPARMVS